MATSISECYTVKFGYLHICKCIATCTSGWYTVKYGDVHTWWCRAACTSGWYTLFVCTAGSHIRVTNVDRPLFLVNSTDPWYTSVASPSDVDITVGCGTYLPSSICAILNITCATIVTLSVAPLKKVTHCAICLSDVKFGGSKSIYIYFVWCQIQWQQIYMYSQVFISPNWRISLTG